MRLLMAVVLSGLFTGTILAQDSETKVDLKGLPPAVQEAVKAQSQGATLRGLSKELKDGVTLYEAELTVGGLTKDITLDAKGKTVSIEEQTTLSKIPGPARAAIQKAVGTGKLVLVEKVTRGDLTYYEGHIVQGTQRSEATVDAKGNPVRF